MKKVNIKTQKTDKLEMIKNIQQEILEKANKKKYVKKNRS